MKSLEQSLACNEPLGNVSYYQAKQLYHFKWESLLHVIHNITVESDFGGLISLDSVITSFSVSDGVSQGPALLPCHLSPSGRETGLSWESQDGWCLWD